MQCLNKNRYKFKNGMKEVWTLQAIMIRQVEKSHHGAGGDMKVVKDQGVHHDKLSHLKVEILCNDVAGNECCRTYKL
jgi:hypothetical protein